MRPNCTPGVRWRTLAGAIFAGILLASAVPGPAAQAAEPPAPKAVKGVYLTAWNAGNPTKLREIVDLIDRTELNAVVVDVKTDAGLVAFPINDATAQNAGAVNAYLSDLKAFAADLRARGIYTIARIVAFKDPVVAPANPGWAVLDTSGAVWRDYNGVAWLNPYSSEAQDYIIRVAKAAAASGFDEVQFDYVRFPTDGDLSAIVYPGEDDRLPEQVIADFLARARAELAPYGVPVSADVFGLVTSVSDDMGIGQQLEAIAGAVEIISPMLYPSHYEAGNLGLPDPNSMPYETVYTALVDARDRIERAGLQAGTWVRPWLQDFSWGYTYGPDEVRAEIEATCDAGYTSWLLWNAANVYTEGALGPDGDLAPHALSSCEVGREVEVALNGQPVRFSGAQPFLTKRTGVTMVPLRPIAEAMGAAVEWDESIFGARVRRGTRTLVFDLGESEAVVNGLRIPLSQPAALWQNQTVVPVRVLAEGLGAQVGWDGANRRVNITLPGTLSGSVCRSGYCPF